MKKIEWRKIPSTKLAVRILGAMFSVTVEQLLLLMFFIAVSFYNPLGFVGVGMAATLTKEQEEQQAELLKKVSDETKKAIGEFKGELTELVKNAKAGLISQKDFDDKIKEFGEKLQQFDAAKFKQFEESLEALKTLTETQKQTLEKQSASIKKLKEGGVDGKQGSLLGKKLGEFLNTQAYKDFVDSNGVKKAKFELKAVDMTSSYTGTSRVLVTSRSPRIIDYPIIQRLNLRDLLTVGPIDMPFLAFLEVYDWIRNVGTVSENGMLPESSFKVREATADVKRIGTFINLSKRMLKSVPFIQNYLETNLPAMVRYAEDFQLLWGDGAGNNPLGLGQVGRDFATEVNATVAGIAGSVASVASYDAGTQSLITFTANQDIVNGDRITFAGGAGGQVTYNAAFTAYVKSPREIVIDNAYVAGATAAWTFTVASRFKNAIPYAQEIDVLKIAKALIARREYAATGFILHPDDATMIETLKGNDQHYLDVQRFENGVLRIAGVPVVETTAMPSGKFGVGDFSMAAGLLELTPLLLEFSESTQEKLTNTVVAIVQEEVMFPIYNKYMFLFGDFTAAKAAILKP